MSACIQAGASFAVDKWLEDDVIDNKEFDLYSKYIAEWEKVLTSPVSKGYMFRRRKKINVWTDSFLLEIKRP